MTTLNGTLATSATADNTLLIAALRDRGIDAAEVTDLELPSILAGSLREYARHRPVLAITTFETVANQAEYTWEDIGDEAGIDVVKCLWNGFCLPNFGQPYDYRGVLDSFGLVDYDLPSQQLLEQMKRTEFAGRQVGSAYQTKPGGSVYLTPTPSAVQSVWLCYTKTYADTSEIPVNDYDIFLDLVESKLAERAVRKLAANGMATVIKTDKFEVNLGTEIGFFRAVAKEKRTSFVQKCLAGQAVVARS